jgi:uncharacterized protein (DUF58 family)
VKSLRLVALIIAAAVFAQLNDWQPLDRLTIGAVALLVLAYLWSKWSLKDLMITRSADTDRAQVGQPIREKITVRNSGLFAKLWLEARDLSSLPSHNASRVIHIRGRRSAQWIVETIAARRGRYHLGPMRIKSGDPFGVFPSVLNVPATIDLLIYPAAVDVSGFPLPLGVLPGGNIIDRKSPFTTPSVTGIRDYVPGDAYNRISWAATARTGRLMVKEFDHDPSADVWIVIDLDSSHSIRASRALSVSPGAAGKWPVEAWLNATEEYAITIAASLTHRCLNQGRSVGVILSGSHYEVIAADRSDRQYVKILETLAVAEADGHRPLAEVLVAEARRFTRHSTLIVITSSTDESWVRMMAEITGKRVRSAAIFVEPETFGHAPSSLLIVSNLLASGISTHLIKYGDDISRALSANGVNHSYAGRAPDV